MSAVIDRPHGLTPTIGGSTYVKPSEMDWKPTRFEKVSIKVLYEDAERGEMTLSYSCRARENCPSSRHRSASSSWLPIAGLSMMIRSSSRIRRRRGKAFNEPLSRSTSGTTSATM